jgi:hypothetical protein
VALSQSGFDGSQIEFKHRMAYKNSFKFMARMQDGVIEEFGQVLFVFGTVAAMPNHFVRQVETLSATGKIQNLIFRKAADSSLRFELTPAQFLKLRKTSVLDADLAFVEFDRSCPQQRDISKAFLSREKMEKFAADAHPVHLELCSRYVTNGGVEEYSRHTLSAPRVYYQAELAVATAKYVDLMGYDMATSIGMCGAALLITEPKFFGGSNILGLHIAGTKGLVRGRGYTTPITTELLGEVRKFFTPVQCKFTEDLEERGFPVEEVDTEEQSGLTDRGLLAGSFVLLGKLSKGVSLSPNSKLKPSPIKDLSPFGDCGQAPAHMRAINVDGEWLDPMVEGLRNYQSPLEIREVPGLRQAVDVASFPFRNETRFESRRLFSFEEAVKGVEGLKIKAVNRATSAGFPYVFDGDRGKTGFFGEGQDYCFDTAKCSELKERVDQILASAARNERLAHLCVDFLKDELRPYEKVEKCQTRIISGSPLDYVIACRIMFGAFIAANFRHHTATGVCPGINPYHDWWYLVSHLKGGDKTRTKFFDGDFKRFDASEQPYVHWEILDFINRWYDDGEENARIRSVLWLDLVNSRHLCGVGGSNCYVIQWCKSLPSGHPLTTIVNSWYALITLSSCFQHITNGVVEFREMWDVFRPATFGDDNLSGVSDSVADVFNQVTVASAMKDIFNLDYTSGIKGEALRPHKPIEECTFLKRSFERDEDGTFNGWAAPLQLGSCLYTSYFYKNNRAQLSELQSKLDGTLGELCIHAPEIWDEYAPKIFNLMRDLGFEPMYTDRCGFRKETASRSDFWF